MRAFMADNERSNRSVHQVNTDDSTVPSQVQLPPPPNAPYPPNAPAGGNNSIWSHGGRAGNAFSHRQSNQSQNNRGN